MKNQRGFTLVELIVVLAILGILTIIAVFNYTNVQRQARDEQRSADATVVAESLEKYFAEHGEYPSVSQITNSDGTAVKQLLGLTGLDSLLAPLESGSTTNSWKTGTASSTNQVTYSGNTDTSASCTTGTLATDRCNDFKIQYYNEQEGTYTTITSRNKSVAINPIQREGVVTPDAPTVNVTLVGNNATATATVVECQIGATPRYSFQSRTNDGTWGSWTAWSTSTSSSVAASQGMKYGFRGKTQCQVGTVVSSDSPISSEDTYIRPINTPAAPDIYTTASFRPNYNGGLCIDAAGGGNSNGTPIQVYTCNGTAAQDWAYDSNDRTIRPTYNLNLCVTNQGGGMQLVLWTCDGNAARQWNSDTRGYFVSVSTGHCMDAVNWGGSGTPIAAGNCNNATAQIFNPSDSQTAWRWPATSCPAGATVEYRANNQTTSLADSGWFSTGTNPVTIRTTSSQGYTYTTQAQARCYTTYVSSAWSGTGQASINKAVFRPGAATGWAFGVWSGRNGWGWSWDSPACGAGTNRSYIEESWIGTDNNSGGTVSYWMAPRTPNGPGNIWWYTANSTGGAAYIWYAPAGNGRGDTYVSYPVGTVPYGNNVIARTQYRCVNPVTGRSATGDWTQSVTNYT